MQKTALVIMAAGIGSRFGGGIKQLAPVGPNGEIIMDYSIHDALEAGFNKVVFIIRKDLEKDFREVIGNRIEKLCEVEYAFQELTCLPEGFSVPEGRTKPWGTGQAVLVCRDLLQEPFAVINADDYYGKQAFVKVHDYLVAHAGEQYHYCMAGFILKNTLSENGGVTRGICGVSADGMLTSITETHNIEKDGDEAVIRRENGSADRLDTESVVSMNMWGLTPEFFGILEEGFDAFLAETESTDLKAEYLLPTIIGELIEKGELDVRVLRSHDQWFGVTYKEDREAVMNAVRNLIDKGVYPSVLYR